MKIMFWQNLVCMVLISIPLKMITRQLEEKNRLNKTNKLII